MSRVLVIPAAGTGSRLKSEMPKVLVRVGGVAMLDRLLGLYAPAVDRVVLVLHPDFATEVEAHLRSRPADLPVETALQPSPTGMLDAVLCALDPVRHEPPRHVWITWCDQVAIRPQTVERLAELCDGDEAAIILPTLEKRHPYIHFARDAEGVITDVLHRREGDAMPEVGENDMGLFALTGAAFLDELPRFAQDPDLGAATGERNFLPFIPWIHRRAPVRTFPGHHELETLGINTPEDLRQVEAFLTDG